MKTTLRLIIITALVLLSVTAVLAQSKDVVQLKNGSVIKGTILEMIPDKTIKIQTADGNIFVYNMTEVEKISKDASAPVIETKPMNSMESQRGYEGQHSSEGSGSIFSIFGSVALPLGDLAKKDGENAGLAKTGWAAGAQFVTGGSVGFLIEGSYSINKIDIGSALLPGKYEYTGWSSIIGLAGLKLGTDNSNGTNFFIAPVAGVLNQKSPEVTYTPLGVGATSQTWQYAATGTGFAYGAIVEAIFGGRFIVSGKYVASKLKYKYSVDGQDYESDAISRALIFVSLGVAF